MKLPGAAGFGISSAPYSRTESASTIHSKICQIVNSCRGKHLNARNISVCGPSEELIYATKESPCMKVQRTHRLALSSISLHKGPCGQYSMTNCLVIPSQAAVNLGLPPLVPCATLSARVIGTGAASSLTICSVGLAVNCCMNTPSAANQLISGFFLFLTTIFVMTGGGITSGPTYSHRTTAPPPPMPSCVIHQC